MVMSGVSIYRGSNTLTKSEWIIAEFANKSAQSADLNQNCRITLLDLLYLFQCVWPVQEERTWLFHQNEPMRSKIFVFRCLSLPRTWCLFYLMKKNWSYTELTNGFLSVLIKMLHVAKKRRIDERLTSRYFPICMTRFHQFIFLGNGTKSKCEYHMKRCSSE